MADVAFKETVAEQEIVYKKKPVYDKVKRVLDIFLSGISLIVLAIPFLIIALIIYIDDPGPAFFKQIRIGKNGKEFMIYKFRSMKVGAEEMKEELMEDNQDCGATFKLRHDPRRTRFGKFLRKSSIDELPQLINIFKGDMAVIGPRPFIVEEQEMMPDDRLYVKPGLSCYWQIGGKNSLSLPEQIELDRKYIRERSLMTDIKITLKTIVYVFKKENK